MKGMGTIAKHMIENQKNPEEYSGMEWTMMIGGASLMFITGFFIFFSSEKTIWLIIGVVLETFGLLSMFTNINDYRYFKRKKMQKGGKKNGNR